MRNKPCGQGGRGACLSFHALVQLLVLFCVFSAVALGQGVPRLGIGDVVQGEQPGSSTPRPILSSQQASGGQRLPSTDGTSSSSSIGRSSKMPSTMTKRKAIHTAGGFDEDQSQFMVPLGREAASGDVLGILGSTRRLQATNRCLDPNNAAYYRCTTRTVTFAFLFRFLDLRDCGLTDDDHDDLEDCMTVAGQQQDPLLSRVYLQSNQLETLPEGIFQDLTALKYLYIDPVLECLPPLPSDPTIWGGQECGAAVVGQGVPHLGVHGNNLVQHEFLASSNPPSTPSSLRATGGPRLPPSIGGGSSGSGGSKAPLSKTERRAVNHVSDGLREEPDRRLQATNACLDPTSSDYRCTAETYFFSAEFDERELFLRDCGLTDDDLDDLEACTTVAGQQNPPVEWLYLDGNALTTLTAEIFQPMTTVTRLVLTDNALTDLPAGVFEPLSGLKELVLSNNGLDSFPDGVLSPLEDLTYLDLTYNSLTTLPEDAFESVTGLTYLNIHTNALGTLPEGLFQPLTALQYLFLSNNALDTLPEGIFQTLTAVWRLYIANNALTTLPFGIFLPLTALEDLDVSGNTDLECLPPTPSATVVTGYSGELCEPPTPAPTMVPTPVPTTTDTPEPIDASAPIDAPTGVDPASGDGDGEGDEPGENYLVEILVSVVSGLILTAIAGLWKWWFGTPPTPTVPN